MSVKNTAKKSVKVITLVSPKLHTAWADVCNVSSKSENEIATSGEKFAKVLIASKWSVSEKKTFIKETKLVSSFISLAHVPALPTWAAMRTGVKGFKALPLPKQLSLATSSYDVLGVGTGEQLATVKILKEEVAKIRKANTDKRNSKKSAPVTSKKTKKDIDTLTEIRAYFAALDFSKLSETELDIVSEISVEILRSESVDI